MAARPRAQPAMRCLSAASPTPATTTKNTAASPSTAASAARAIRSSAAARLSGGSASRPASVTQIGTRCPAWSSRPATTSPVRLLPSGAVHVAETTLRPASPYGPYGPVICLLERPCRVASTRCSVGSARWPSSPAELASRTAKTASKGAPTTNKTARPASRAASILSTGRRNGLLRLARTRPIRGCLTGPRPPIGSRHSIMRPDHAPRSCARLGHRRGSAKYSSTARARPWPMTCWPRALAAIEASNGSVRYSGSISAPGI